MQTFLDNIRVFICVPGVGKTYLSNIDDNFVDIDNIKSKYKYKFDDNVTDIEIEQNKGKHTRATQKGSKQYIFNVIQDYLNNTNKTLLLAPNPTIVEYIYQQKIPYCLVYHSLDCVAEYKERMRTRGNDENFIQSMLGDEIANLFHKENTNDSRPKYKLELEPGEYLSDVFYNPKKYLTRIKNNY